MWNVPAESQPEQEFLLEQLQLLSSSGITGQQALRAIVQMFPDTQQKITVTNAIKTLQATMRRSRVMTKSPWWDLSCDDGLWLHEQATMNRAQIFLWIST